MGATLVVIACGAAKVWDRHPDRGATRAADAYTGPPFRLNRAYAEAIGDGWLILSAKYGLIAPDFLIPGPYDTTFTRRSSGPVGGDLLRRHVAT